jgi:hypothetical protein
MSVEAGITYDPEEIKKIARKSAAVCGTTLSTEDEMLIVQNALVHFGKRSELPIIPVSKVNRLKTYLGRLFDRRRNVPNDGD